MSRSEEDQGWEPVHRSCFRPGPMPVVMFGLGGTVTFICEVLLYIKHRKCLHKHDDDGDKCGSIETGGPFILYIFMVMFLGFVVAFVKQVKLNLNSRSVSTGYLQTGYYDDEGREEEVYIRDFSSDFGRV